MILNKVTQVHIDKSKIKPQKKSILKLLGVESNNCDEHTSNVVDLCLKESSSLVEPKGGFSIYSIDEIKRKEGILKINNSSFDIHKIISNQLKNTKYIAVFLVTIGSNVEQLSKSEMQKGNMLEGYIYDLIGSEAAEETAEYVHRSISEIALEEGYKITNRFSPGYCNWDIIEQFKLFELFDSETFGIKLTDSALMSPIKSVSGIVGIGENATFRPYTCNMCSDENCIYRNKKG